MSSDIQHLHDNEIAPVQGNIAVIPITTSSASHDLTAISGAPSFTSLGQFITMEVDAETWFFFTNTAAQTVDETADDAGATVGARMAADTVRRFRFPRITAGQPIYLVIKGQAAGKCRLYVSSSEH